MLEIGDIWVALLHIVRGNVREFQYAWIVVTL